VFPLSKLDELSPRTRQRKIARILQGLEVELVAGRSVDAAYVAEILRHLGGRMPSAVENAAGALEQRLAGSPGVGFLREVNDLRHALLQALGAEPAEWDLVDSASGNLDRSGTTTLPMTVYLEDLRSPFNVGSIVRSAEAFGVERLLLSPRTPAPDHPRARRTALGAHAALPWQRAELASLSGHDALFALELGGTPIERFPFPLRGTVLVGSEELGLSPEALRLADASRGRASILLGGAKRSLNVSVAFGILIHAWRNAIIQEGPPSRLEQD
jgi:TrmH family RNA methyltransferase